jgi:hypothetical protein
MTTGAIYILTQDARYVPLALGSLATVKRAMPDLPVTFLSQFPVSSPLIDQVISVTPTRDGFYDKTRLMRESPYDRTLFIDADIYAVKPFPEMFDLLDRFDCAATHEEYLNTDWFNRYPRPDIPASFPEFNTGILLFNRSPQMDGVLKKWEALYADYLQQKPDQPINDQPFFRAAIYESDVRIATLPREYNCKFRGQGYLNGPVKLLHGHIEYQFDTRQLTQAIAAVNASERPRVYIAGKVYDQELTGRLVSRRKAHKIGTFPELPGSLMLRRARRLRQIIQEQGLGKMLAKAFAGKQRAA